VLGLIVTDLLQELYPYLRVGPSTVRQCGRTRALRSAVVHTCFYLWLLDSDPKIVPPFRKCEPSSWVITRLQPCMTVPCHTLSTFPPSQTDSFFFPPPLLPHYQSRTIQTYGTSPTSPCAIRHPQSFHPRARYVCGRILSLSRACPIP
jgi:hypothetical protein